MLATTKKPNKSLHSFSYTGEGITDLVRSFWVEEDCKRAIDTCRKVMGMNNEQALELITGSKKLVGDTATDKSFTSVDDNQTELHGIELSLQNMIKRIEAKFIEFGENIVIYKESPAGMWDADRGDEDDYRLDMIERNEKKRDQVREQLEALYAVSGLDPKALPYRKIRSYSQIKMRWTIPPVKTEQEKTIADLEAEQLALRKKYVANIQVPIVEPEEEKDVTKSKEWAQQRVAFLKSYKPAEDKVQEYLKARSKVKDASPEEKLAMRHVTKWGGAYYLRHCNAEQCKAEKLWSGYLTPEGVFYGAEGSMYVHNYILGDLEELGVIEQKNADLDGARDAGWVKLSAGHDWMCFFKRKRRLTDAQVEFMIDYTTIVDQRDSIYIDGNNIPLTAFATLLDGAECDFRKLSK